MSAVPSYEALEIIARSVSGALGRAGIIDCDDPGEAIDEMRERYEAQLAALSALIGSSLDMPVGKEHSMQVLNYAVQIADHTVRSDIECYAQYVENIENLTVYDITKPLRTGPSSVDERAEALTVVQRAARYIHLRGPAFPWQMVRQFDNPNLVYFADPEVG